MEGTDLSRRQLLLTAAAMPLGTAAAAAAGAAPARPSAAWTKPVLALPLAGDFSGSGGTRAEPAGPHRFLKIDGVTGYHARSLKSSLKVPSAQHTQDRGSIVFWLAPLESLSVSPSLSYVADKNPRWMDYGLFADVPRTNAIEEAVFAWYWRSYWHPQMIAKFKSGAAGNAAADFAVTPYVPVEHMPLHERQWYQFAFTWDKPNSRFKVYVNGILCGTTRFPFKCDQARPELYLGNTAMVFADVAIFDAELAQAEIADRYAAAKRPALPRVNAELAQLYTVQPKPKIDWAPARDWTLAYQRSLTKPADFDGWKQQGCQLPGFALLAKECTPTGLLVQTPDIVHTESRVYFWSPDIFEGDLAVEYEFRPESDTGLALLIVQATGMQREDFLTDHPPRTSGAMSTIIADQVMNYHWEYYRHSVDVRGDLGTQVMVKNPWERPMAMASLPPIAVNTWHKLLFVQEGNRLRCGMDGEWVFDVRDDAFAHSGPVFNSGRIGLRQMYSSRMRYRNLRVWNRSQFA